MDASKQISMVKPLSPQKSTSTAVKRQAETTSLSNSNLEFDISAADHDENVADKTPQSSRCKAGENTVTSDVETNSCAVHDAIRSQSLTQVEEDCTFSQDNPDGTLDLACHSGKNDIVQKPVDNEKSGKRRRQGNGEGRKHRGKRGGTRKGKRAGARRGRRKTDRLALKYIRVGYWNCRNAKQRGPVPERLINDFDIIMLQEFNIDGYECPGYTSYINPAGHGQCLLVKNGVKHEVLDLGQWNHGTLEVQGIQIDNGGTTWNLVNVYAAVDSLVTKEHWNWLKELEKIPGNRLLICGDFNAQSRAWDRTGENRQGIALAEALVDADVVCVNDGRPTRMATTPGDAEMAVDLAFVTQSALLDTKWNVLGKEGSDYMPCSVLISKAKLDCEKVQEF